PMVVLPEPRFPQVMLLPGATPAQDFCQVRGGGEAGHVDADLGDNVSAARFPTPVMVSSRSRARANGRPASPVGVATRDSTRSSSRAIAASRWAVWFRHNPI